MIKNYLYAGVCLGTALLSVDVLAGDATPGLTPIQNGPSVTFSAFGTLGVVETNTDNGTYTTGAEKHGATKTADFGPDTKAGAQMDLKFNDSFSATVQAFSKQNALGSYEPDIEWAFAKLKMGEGFDLRLGRMGAPFFMSSDFRNVGYTNLTVRTPNDVYEAVPVRSYEGGDVLYRGDYGSTTFNGQLWLGRATTLIGQDASVYLHNIVGLNISAENGPLTLRLGHMKTRLDATGTGPDITGLNQLLGGLQQLSQVPGLGALAPMGEDLAVDNKYATFTGVGAILDLGNWVASAELTKRKTESTYVHDTTGWYTTVGYRIDKFTPYVSLSGRKTNSVTSYPYPAAIPYLGPYGVIAQQLVYGVNSQITDETEKTGALGVRWDAGNNYDIKAEFQQIRVPAMSTGSFSIPSGFYSVNTNVNVFSLCVDFVF